MVKFSTAVLGFSRMGPNRELKFSLEKHWKGQLDEAGLIQVANDVEDMAWAMQVEAGIDKVTVGDFCLYDNVLQWADWLGVVPARFQSMEGGMERMFAMARGVDGAPALSKSNRVFVSNTTCLQALILYLSLLSLLSFRHEEMVDQQLPLHGPRSRRDA
jgi:methionine synthase II (cobalamin-independent)